MLCQNCSKKHATVHFVKIINGVKTEMHLCEKCAPMAQQEFPSIESFDIKVSDIINSFFGGSIGLLSGKCDTCNTTFNMFSQTGKLGCPDCYDAFWDKLQDPLRRIHGGVRHTGKIPKRTGGKTVGLEKLKEDLKNAIAREDFENAAIIRDEIRRLEGGK
ncbi:MAG: UvrB/uvrC motif protein [Firmicutes bacterium ADurb.Bin193]|nr:MAG: UvrB/uvrC motif protein [Firmicutes bacterium ADurb.Bin193]